MEIIQKDLNAIWYTKDKLFCKICEKQIEKGIEVENNGLFGISCCFQDELPFMFNNNYIKIREIIDINFNKRKEIKKLERNKLSLKLRFEILKRDNFKCILCGDNYQLEIDHIMPIVNGGKTEKENLRTLCFRCNRGKGIN
jgi:5-methylcytosine-specific restriction endonuclease McrA